jgi:hypothetical protein
VNNWSDEQTDEPLYADDRNFYTVEAWSREGMRIDALRYAAATSIRREKSLSRLSSIGRA